MQGDQLSCSAPPLAPKISLYKMALSVSTDMSRTGWSDERHVELASIQGLGLSLDRSFLQGSVPLTISGSYFPYEAYFNTVYMSLVQVRLGRVAAAGKILSSSTMACTVPANSAGSYPVEISLDGQSFAALNFTFQYFVTPSVLSISPTKALRLGSTLISVAGSGFPPNSLLNGIACKYETSSAYKLTVGTFVTSTRLLCFSPEVTLTTPYQDYTVSISFNSENNVLDAQWTGSLSVRIFQVPQISTLTPTILSIVGGTTLTLTGTNFIATDQVCIHRFIRPCALIFCVDCVQLWIGSACCC